MELWPWLTCKVCAQGRARAALHACREVDAISQQAVLDPLVRADVPVQDTSCPYYVGTSQIPSGNFYKVVVLLLLFWDGIRAPDFRKLPGLNWGKNKPTRLPGAPGQNRSLSRTQPCRLHCSEAVGAKESAPNKQRHRERESAERDSERERAERARETE